MLEFIYRGIVYIRAVVYQSHSVSMMELECKGIIFIFGGGCMSINYKAYQACVYIGTVDLSQED